MFVKHYLECGNASEAMRRAGYKFKNPHKISHWLTKHPIIKDLIGKARQKVEQKVDVSINWRFNVLKEIALEGQNADRIRAIAEINKMLGDYAPTESKVSVTNTVSSTDDLTHHYAADERTVVTVQ